MKISRRFTPERKAEYEEHFISRLKERHGLDMSPEIYQQLSALRDNYPVIYHLTVRKFLSTLVYEGKEIYIIYESTEQILLTALPDNIRLPVPYRLHLAGVTHEEFSFQLNKYNIQVEEAVAWLEENPNKKNDMYTLNPLYFPEEINRIAKHKKRYDELGIIKNHYIQRKIVSFIIKFVYGLNAINGPSAKTKFKEKKLLRQKRKQMYDKNSII